MNRSPPLHPAPPVIHTGTIHRILRPPSVPLTRRSTLVPPITKQPGHKYILSDLYASLVGCSYALGDISQMTGARPLEACPYHSWKPVGKLLLALVTRLFGQRRLTRRDRAAPAARLAVIGQVADARRPGDAGSRRPEGVSIAPRPLGASPRSAGVPGTAPAAPPPRPSGRLPLHRSTLILVPLASGNASASHWTSPPLTPAPARTKRPPPECKRGGSAACPLPVLLRNDSAGGRLPSSGCRMSHASQLGREKAGPSGDVVLPRRPVLGIIVLPRGILQESSYCKRFLALSFWRGTGNPLWAEGGFLTGRFQGRLASAGPGCQKGPNRVRGQSLGANSSCA